MAPTTPELVRIAEVGGGFTISIARLSPSDLVKIVSATRNDGGTITLRDCSTKITSDLVKIASACQARVVFDFEE